MGVSVQISGIGELHKLVAQIKAAGDKGLGRQMSQALAGVVAPVEAAIIESAAETMPSGYEETLTRSLKHRRTSRAAARLASLRLTTFAEGTAERRDLPSLERGRLRHPVFGRSRRTRRGRRPNPWASTAIRPGFHQRGVDNAGPLAEQALQKVLADFADRILKG
jgi:hypothetical protein